MTDTEFNRFIPGFIDSLTPSQANKLLDYLQYQVYENDDLAAWYEMHGIKDEE